MDYKDYYATLGVSRSADKDEIQKAYRKLARKYHPDVNRDPEAEAKFKEINEAHEVLKDPDKRSKYDQFGSAWKQSQQTGAPPPGFEDIFTVFTSGGEGRSSAQGFGGQGGFSSFFDMLFGTDFGAGGSGPGPRVTWTTGADQSGFGQQGTDHEATMSLSLEEAVRGGERELTLTDPHTGRRRTLRVKIPPGVRPGQRIRLAGQGGMGAGGSTRGDLFLSVELIPDSRFKLDGSNLETILPVTPWEAALGGTAQIRTLDGDVTVKIPAGSSSGRKIRLRGKGFPTSAEQAGDLLAEVRIQVPERLSPRERELYEQLAKESDK